MKKLALLSFLLISPLTQAAESFGTLTLQESSAKSLKDVIAQFKSDSATGLLVKGVVKKVCEKEGCWLSLEDQGQSVHVFFKNHSFFVSNKLKNQPVLVEGTLYRKVRTVAEQKHLAQDAGESKKTIDAIKQDKTFFEFEATGVKTI